MGLPLTGLVARLTILGVSVSNYVPLTLSDVCMCLCVRLDGNDHVSNL